MPKICCYCTQTILNPDTLLEDDDGKLWHRNCRIARTNYLRYKHGLPLLPYESLPEESQRHYGRGNRYTYPLQQKILSYIQEKKITTWQQVRTDLNLPTCNIGSVYKLVAHGKIKAYSPLATDKHWGNVYLEVI